MLKNDPALRDYVHPHQLAVCARGGAEAIIHAARAVVVSRASESYSRANRCENAFNSIERAHILQETVAHAPGIARWVHHVYGV